MRILLADDDPNVRWALRVLLENEPDIAVAGECGAARELVEQVVSTQANVVLIDWSLPDLRASRAIVRLRAARPGCRVVALSVRPEEREEALRAGVVGFVCKADAPESLLGALRELRHRAGDALAT